MSKRSAVLDLPPDLKSALDRRLAENGFQGYIQLAEWLGEMGYRISKSSLQRYGQSFEERLATLRVVTEQAKAITESAPDEAGAVNDALQRLVQEKLFRVLMEFDPDSVRKVNLGSIAAAIADLGRASVQQKKWMASVKEKAEAAAAKVESVARRGGLSDDAVQTIRREILGVAG